MRKWICLFFYTMIITYAPLNFAVNADDPSTVNSVTIEPRISYEQYQMPDSIRPLGVMGLHGLIDFNEWFYGGLGFYGAVRGQSGGFFALALEGGLQHRLWRQI